MIALELLRKDRCLTLDNSSLLSQTVYVSVVDNVWTNSRVIL